jgi:hypothetical protein
MTEKTILEFAEDIGVTKKQVENKLAKLKKEGTYLGTLKGGKRYLLGRDQEVLEALLLKGKEVPKKEVPKGNYKAPKSEKVQMSYAEYEFLKEQHENDLKQIENLTNLLDQQQKLTAGILSEKNQLQLELIEEKNKSFWSKFFKKR